MSYNPFDSAVSMQLVIPGMHEDPLRMLMSESMKPSLMQMFFYKYIQQQDLQTGHGATCKELSQGA